MNKKREFNGQIESKVKDNITKTDILRTKKLFKKEIPNKLKVNLSSSLKYISKKKNPKSKSINDINKTFFRKIISKNIQKYNTNSQMKNIMLINNLINCKSSHFLAIFKDYLITDYIEEFLRRIYFLNESIERMPKLYNYYKNYLMFFCKPVFVDSFSNEIIKNYGDLNAECFYKNNLAKKRSHHEDKRILDKKFIGKDMIKNNINKEDEELVKTVFTKSIKNSIDNINEEDSEGNNKKGIIDNNLFTSEFSSKMQQEMIGANIWGCDNDNMLSDGNSLLLMINEIKDIQNNKKITEKTIKINKNVTNGNYKKNNNPKNNINKYISKESTYKTLYTDKNNININSYSLRDNNNKDSKCNILKTNTYTHNKNTNYESIQNMIYSPKSKKNVGFSIKKDKEKVNIDKTDKLLSPKTKNANTNINTNTNNKNHNSIIVNINININTNQNNNNLSNNIKSPIHNINKKRFPLSPLSPINLNILNEKEIQKKEKEILLSSKRIKETEKDDIKEKEENTNYIKIIKKKNNYSNLLLSNKRNKKIVEINKIKTLNSLEVNELSNKQNYSCNKDILLYNKENKELNKNLINSAHKNVYFSPKKLEFKSKYSNSTKDLENTNEYKKYLYYKKPNNNYIYSPLNKKINLDKKYFSYKKLDINNE